MRINHNIAALNTYRQLSINNAASQRSLEKLSSGLRINRTGDDAAGLAISEKMRGQIRGLEMASKNAQDGISLIQTAEGALNETHSILQRMRELAVQAASDTNTVADRAELQKEFDQLTQEITRIGENTDFNTQKLLNGTFTGILHIGANENQNITLNVADMRAYQLGVVGDAKLELTADVTGTADTIDDGTYTVQEKAADSYVLVDTSGAEVATSTDGKAWKVNTEEIITFTEAVTSGVVTITTDDSDKQTATGTAIVENTGLQAGAYTYDSTASALKDVNGNVVASYDSTNKVFVDAEGNEMLALDDPTGIEEIYIGGVDISSQATANTAITTINDAVETVSAERSKLGAYQNRLEHTINNLGTAAENLTAAESRIRDVDMAKEMMEFTKMNILQQAAQAMLAQANMQPQGVLQLLR